MYTSWLKPTQVLALLALFSVAALHGAEPSSDKPLEPIYESKDGWAFDKAGDLTFHNESPNPDGTRFLVWKEYIWAITDDTITIIDQRADGTQLKGKRHQTVKNEKIQKDKDLMNDLKGRAAEIRDAGKPKQLPVRVGVGAGVGFGSGRTSGAVGVGVGF